MDTAIRQVVDTGVQDGYRNQTGSRHNRVQDGYRNQTGSRHNRVQDGYRKQTGSRHRGTGWIPQADR